MVTRTFVLAAALLGAAGARAECINPAVPGTSIGPVRIGMGLEEVRKLGEVAAVDTEWSAVGAVQFRLGKDKKVEEVRTYAAQVCIQDGVEMKIDMANADVHLNGPAIAGCGGEGSAIWEGWRCPDHGILLFWEAGRPGVWVMKPTKALPQRQPPPPAPWNVKQEGKAVCKDRPNSHLACGFFGRAPALALECYLPDPCMGEFGEGAGKMIDVHWASGERLGSMERNRDGASLVYRFAKTPPARSVVRVIVPLGLKSVRRGEEPAKSARDVVWLIGSRRLNTGFVLDLEVPPAAVVAAAAK